MLVCAQYGFILIVSVSLCHHNDLRISLTRYYNFSETRQLRKRNIYLLYIHGVIHSLQSYRFTCKDNVSNRIEPKRIVEYMKFSSYNVNNGELRLL